MNKIYTEDIDIDQRLIGRRLFDQSRIIFPLLYQLLERFLLSRQSQLIWIMEATEGKPEWFQITISWIFVMEEGWISFEVVSFKSAKAVS